MTVSINGSWAGISQIGSKRYTCGHCGNNISSQVGYRAQTHSAFTASIYICHDCNGPTLFSGADQVPGPLLGGNIESLPDDIRALYDEIRNSTTTNSYTAAVLAARKLLMHIAVQCGADPGKNFVTYVDYLVDNNYTPPNSKAWIDQIRTIGNEANHEIVIMDEARASSIIRLIEMLLKFNYEFPALAPSET